MNMKVFCNLQRRLWSLPLPHVPPTEKGTHNDDSWPCAVRAPVASSSSALQGILSLSFKYSPAFLLPPPSLPHSWDNGRWMDVLFLQLIKIISSVESQFMWKECFQMSVENPASCPRTAACDVYTYLFLPGTITETADVLLTSGSSTFSHRWRMVRWAPWPLVGVM